LQKDRKPLILKFGFANKNKMRSKNIKKLVSQLILAIGHKIVDLQIPKSVLIVMINRNNKLHNPNGSTRVVDGDKLLIMAEDATGIEKISAML
jgi:cell volume regulation protein A